MKLTSFAIISASAVLLQTAAICQGQNILFQDDFEAGTAFDTIEAAPYTWTEAFEQGTSDARVTASPEHPFGPGLAVDGDWHLQPNSIGIYTQPLATVVDGYRLTADLWAETNTSLNAFGLGSSVLGDTPGVPDQTYSIFSSPTLP